MSKLGLSAEEETNLKTICEYVFFDQFKDNATYPRFEQCFQPLFNNVNISMDKTFKNICGDKKKYINYQRLAKAYLDYKNKSPSLSPDVKTFFEKLITSILKKENSSVGKIVEKGMSFVTPKSCKKRECITSINVFSDNKGAVHGLLLEYDSISKNKMYPSKIEQDLVISLEMSLGIVDNKPIVEKKVGKMQGIKEGFYRDAVTHIFGTLNPKNNFINFLGFKCVSGKTVFVGSPEGDGFIFGKFGTKFHELRIQMTTEGITLLQPTFNPNPRTNFYLSTEANNLTADDLKKDILIQDEAQLAQLKDSTAIDKLITIPILEDSRFFDEKLKDNINGNDYKEVVNQAPREWIMKDSKATNNIKPLSLDDALKGFEQEKEKAIKVKEEEAKEAAKEAAELTAKGKKGKKKSKSKKKKQKPKLHKTKAIKGCKKRTAKKWNGHTKNAKPMDIIKNKDNYKKLKDKVSNIIRTDIIKLGGDDKVGSQMGLQLLNKIIPDPKASRNISQKVNDSSDAKSSKKPKLISKNMKGQVKKVIDRGNQSKSVEPSKKSNIVIQGISDDTQENNVFFSDAMQISNTIEGSGGSLLNIAKNEKTKMRAGKGAVDTEGKIAMAQNNWRNLSKKLTKMTGIYLLQTIGCVLKAIRILDDEITGKKIISLAERLELFQLLEENEKIVDFLSRDDGDDEEAEATPAASSTQTSSIEDLFVLEEHPEEITSLADLESKIQSITKLLENKNIKPEDKTKLEQLYNLYLQRKNILIENKTESAKNEVIKQNKIDVDKYKKEEEAKRNKAMEEAQKKLEEEMAKKQAGMKGEVSILTQPKPEKIFHKQEMYQGKDPWTDPLFKPEKNTLCSFNASGWILPEDALEDDVNDWESYKWCRVQEIFDSANYAVFESGISVEDIQQGNISDCYFLSVLGALCKFPKLLEKLFFVKEKSKEHLYGIYLYINGQWKLVLLDDFLPYIGTGFKQFAMSKSEGNEIWVSLIEKAWAKANGQYIRIGTGGSPNEVFDVLTEAFSEEIAIKPAIQEQIWQKMISGEKSGFVMTAGTCVSDDLEEIGLWGGHAYTVLGVHEINGERVVRLRNPWGNFEFNGDWSDTSSKWTEALKKQYKYYEKDDGDFFMGFKDFIKYYVTMGIAKLHPNYVNSAIKIKKTEAVKCQLIKINIPKDNVHVYFQLYGKNPRIPNKKGEYPVSALSNLILVDKDFNYLNSSSANNMHICVENTLKKGDYYLFTEANFRYNTKNLPNHGYTITAYSNIQLTLQNVTNSIPVAEKLRKVMVNYCQKVEKPNPQSNGVNVYVTKSFNKDIPYKVLAFENKTNKNFKVTVGIECKGEKSCCFYCDEVASEKDDVVVKDIKANSFVPVIIMYYSMSSLFNFTCSITEAEGKNDVYNHPVFKEEGETIDDNGKLKQYILEKDEDSYAIGLDNSSGVKIKLKLVLEGLKVTDGEFKGKNEPVFELESKGRIVFNVSVTEDADDVSFKFDFA